MNGIPMHRGLGPHVRGESDRIRGLGTIGAPATFGHGGVGSSYSWADPTSGVSFTYLTNYVAARPVAFGAARPRRQPGARGDRLTRVQDPVVDKIVAHLGGSPRAGTAGGRAGEPPRFSSPIRSALGIAGAGRRATRYCRR